MSSQLKKPYEGKRRYLEIVLRSLSSRGTEQRFRPGEKGGVGGGGASSRNLLLLTEKELSLLRIPSI